MSSSLVPPATATIEQLHRDGYAVIEDVLDRATVHDLRDRVEGLLRREREHPFDPGADQVDMTPDEAALAHFDNIWQLSDVERQRLARRIRQRQLEHDTPWPVPAADVCISFTHIPTLFDDGRSQRIFNLIQYGRSWVKPFVDLRTPMTAEQARQLSPRLRYLMGCNASAPVRG